MFYTRFQNEKKPFQAIKTRSSKSRKTDTFPKGLTHGFCPKMALFPTFFFRQDRLGKFLLRDSRTKKKPIYAIKRRSLKSRKIDIFLKVLTHGFGPKMADFPTFFFQAILAGGMSFTIFYIKKNAFVAYGNQKFKKSKNSHFSKGVYPQFWSKIYHFSNFFFS